MFLENMFYVSALESHSVVIHETWLTLSVDGIVSITTLFIIMHFMYNPKSEDSYFYTIVGCWSNVVHEVEDLYGMRKTVVNRTVVVNWTASLNKMLRVCFVKLID